MTLDPGLATVVVAAIAGVTSIGTAVMTRKQGQKINESHRMLTVNHHESEKRGEEPTLLDRIDDVKVLVQEVGGDLLALGRDFNTHVAHSNQMDLRLMQVEGEVRRSR